MPVRNAPVSRSLSAVGPNSALRKELPGGQSFDRYLALWLLASLCFFSWAWPPTQKFWTSVDLMAFNGANVLLEASPGWRRICAAINSSLFDVVAVVATICLLVAAASGRKWKNELGNLAVLVLALALAKFVVADMVLGDWCHYQRASPTLTLDSIRVSESELWVATKDRSPFCFPSDHGVIVLAVAFYVMRRAPEKRGYAFAYALLFASPRFLVGAHWFTDIVIGSAFIASVSQLLHFLAMDRLISHADNREPPSESPELRHAAR